MPIDPKAVGLKGGPVRRSWTSKDALLYALGVGAGVDELAFNTENTKDTPQRVLPTMAVVLGGGGIPFDKLGTFNPTLRCTAVRASSCSARSRPTERSRAPGPSRRSGTRGRPPRSTSSRTR